MSWKSRKTRSNRRWKASEPLRKSRHAALVSKYRREVKSYWASHRPITIIWDGDRLIRNPHKQVLKNGRKP